MRLPKRDLATDGLHACRWGPQVSGADRVSDDLAKNWTAFCHAFSGHRGSMQGRSTST
jgi:hypothetical protein